MAEEKKILETIKDLLDVGPEDDTFDNVILVHIDTVFSDLYSLGVGPKEPFALLDFDDPKSVLWNSFLEGKKGLNMVRSFIYLKVKLLFDPPQTSFALSAIKDQLSELEFRLHAEDDIAYKENRHV